MSLFATNDACSQPRRAFLADFIDYTKAIRTPALPVVIGLIALCLSFAACAEEEAQSESVIEGTPLYFEPIGRGHEAALTDSTTMEMVFRQRSGWMEMADSLRPAMPFDSVDFEQAIVLAVAIPQTTSGYSVEFTSVEERDSVVIAEYMINAPSDDCLTTVADVVPFQAVMVRRTELPIRFKSGMQEYRCTIGPRR